MLLYLFLLFTVVPIVELSILIWIGSETEWWLPVLIVIATGVAGAWLARWQGWRVMRRIQEELHGGRMPAGALLDAVLILIAGLFLISPGVLSDIAGVLLLVPPTRGVVKHLVARWIKRNFEVRTATSAAEFWHGANAAPRDEIIDVKVIDTHVEDYDEAAPRAPR